MKCPFCEYEVKGKDEREALKLHIIQDHIEGEKDG